MRWRVSLRAAGLVVVLAAAVQLHAGVMYNVTDLGSLGGWGGVPTAINDLGQVVGYSYQPRFQGTRAFRTAPNQVINALTDDLGTLPGGTYTKAYGINNLGQVVGRSGLSPGDMDGHAFRTAPNQAINPATDDLGTLGGSFSAAYAINDAGQVVGEAKLAGETFTHAFRTRPNQPIDAATDDLGTLGGFWSAAYGINASGQAVGAARLSDGGGHAFRTGPGGTINPLTDDLGPAGGGSEGAAINASGQVAGSFGAEPLGGMRIFRTAPNKAIDPLTDDLGVIGAGPRVRGMNDRGDIVGWYFAPPAYDYQRAFVCLGSNLIDLNDLINPVPGLTLEVAYGINNRGQIVVSGNRDGQIVALRLDPVPEPSALSVITGVAALALCRRRHSIGE